MSIGDTGVLLKTPHSILFGVCVAVISAALSAATAVSLIFFSVPDFVYLNITGLFIFCAYFGFLPAMAYLALMQAIMIKFNLFDAFYSYSLVLGLVNALIISLSVRKISFCRIIVAAIFMAIFSRLLAGEIYAFTTGGQALGLAQIYSPGKILSQFKIYLFSAVCAAVFFLLLDNIFHKGERNETDF